MRQIGSSYPNEACRGFSEACWAQIDASALKNLASSCLDNLSAKSVSGMTAKQLAEIPVSTIVSFAQAGSLVGNACAGFTADQLSKMATSYPNGNCNEITTECAGKSLNYTCYVLTSFLTLVCELHTGNMTTTALAQISADCFAGLGRKGAGGLNAAQIAVIPTKALVTFDAFGLFTDNACSGMICKKKKK